MPTSDSVLSRSAADPGDELTSCLQPGTALGPLAEPSPGPASASTNLPSLHVHGQGPMQGALRPFCFLPSSPSPQLLECVCLWWKKCKEQREAAGNAALPGSAGCQSQAMARATTSPEVRGAPGACRDELNNFWSVLFRNLKRQMCLLHCLHEHRLAAKPVSVRRPAGKAHSLVYKPPSPSSPPRFVNGYLLSCPKQQQQD